MLPQALFAASVVVFLAAAVLFLLVRRERKIRELRTIDDDRRRRLMESDLGDEIIWNQGSCPDELTERDFSRRWFLPKVLTGIAAFVLFRMSSRGIDIQPEASRDSSGRMPDLAFTDHDDSTSHSDVHFDHDDAAREHVDSHSDFNRHHDHDDSGSA